MNKRHISFILALALVTACGSEGGGGGDGGTDAGTGGQCIDVPAACWPAGACHDGWTRAVVKSCPTLPDGGVALDQWCSATDVGFVACSDGNNYAGIACCCPGGDCGVAP